MVGVRKFVEGWLAWCTERLVPAARGRHPEELRRTHLALSFTFILTAQVPIFAAVYLALGVPGPVYGILIGGVLCMLSPLLVRAFSATVAHHYIVAILFGVLVNIAVFTGGLFAPALWWLALVPIVAMLSTGKRGALAWLAVVSVALVVFALLANAGIVLQPFPRRSSLAHLTLIAVVELAVVLYLIASSYERARARMLESLEHALQEAQRVERELRQSQKLEAVGHLASGIAHEINTPLQFVSDSVHFIEEATTELLGQSGAAPDDESIAYLRENVPEALRLMTDGLARVASIVSSLREFAHPSTTRNDVDLNRSVDAALTLAKHEYKYVADVQVQRGQLPTVRANSGEISQVLVNLLVNAAHAIAERGGRRGVIRVSTAVEEDHALITVEDDGVGIDDSIRDKIFEPFFTTKPVGKGAGQGLAIARAIVERHAGSLSFTSEPRVGSKFYVRLPLSRDIGCAA